VGNEENGYLVTDPNKLLRNVPKDPSETHKKILKEEILEEISEKFMEKILVMANQNVYDVLKDFKNTKEKEYEKTQKQIN
jgi:predicted glycosyltransferase